MRTTRGPDEPYIFWYKEETHDLALRLAEHLQAKSEPWDDFEYWRGSDEIYLRTLGCHHCITIESPAGWPMQERIRVEFVGSRMVYRTS